ncbi:Ger(x)C family spore germination protein [Paenibacillus filicis]|uniref:Ger(X)C family spore germination protein n=1 Tax=Paenibacillus gyeongsangnamensis TaxID=3388067 RepID=A0ABT4QE42_9BACL|nr:Ger(x)C family spore germination protein [Paenibacillus filicis]MCZ8515132.1 Ger(x)C family spore germination protein [Paenibacillus filicis]
MNFFSPGNKSRALLITFLCASVLPLAGCWDRKELNDVVLIMGAGIDKKGDKIEASVQLTVPRAMGGGEQSLGGGGGGGGKEKPSLVRSATGVTVADAMARLQEKVPRKLFWGHTKILVIGEKLAKEGIREYMDYIARHPEPRLRMFVFVSKGKAADILDTIPKLERESAEAAREEAKFRFAMQVTFKDLMQMFRGDSGAAALPWLEMVPGRPGGTESVLRLNGTAVFKKDKMVGYIDDEVTRGVVWLRNEIKTATITIEPKEAEGHISFVMLRATTKLIPQISGGTWKMTAKLETEDDIVENTTSLNMMNPTVVKLLEQEAEKDLEERTRKALDEGQKKLKADIFGFAEAFHRKYPKQWEASKDRWDEIFPNIDVQLESKVRIRRPGLATEPPAVPEEEVKAKEKEVKQKEKEVKEK